VVCADLTKAFLGLPDDQYAELAESVECIVHSAANVRHYGAYEEFHTSNVTATEQLLKLAQEGRRSPSFHYISTTSTGMGVTEGDFAIFSDNDIDIGQKPGNVYVPASWRRSWQLRHNAPKGLMPESIGWGMLPLTSRPVLSRKTWKKMDSFSR
jgi:thioester reductase-like protein